MNLPIILSVIFGLFGLFYLIKTLFKSKTENKDTKKDVKEKVEKKEEEEKDEKEEKVEEKEEKEGDIYDLSYEGDKGGVVKTIIKPGFGPRPPFGNTVEVHYEGKFENGDTFDSSRERGERLKFNLGMGEVIQGWDLGIASMKVGEVARFKIRSDYAYGRFGDGWCGCGKIPGNTTLYFEVRLFGFKKPDSNCSLQ